jgi:hypothetical protein
MQEHVPVPAPLLSTTWMYGSAAGKRQSLVVGYLARQRNGPI